MTLKEILEKEREVWGPGHMTLRGICVAMGVVFGDICRQVRGFGGDEMKKELGNMLSSTVRWCDDLGYDPDECIEIALEAQRNFRKENP